MILKRYKSEIDSIDLKRMIEVIMWIISVAGDIILITYLLY